MPLLPKYRTVVNPRAGGLAGRAARTLLKGPAAVYGCLMQARNRGYERGWLASRRLSVPVICVGNLTVGGTGKTPMTAWLCRELLRRGRKPAVICRGYKGQGRENDEVRLLRRAVPQAPVVVDADRVRGGETAIRDHGADVVVMDDGFQHRRLWRDLDLVMVDCMCPFGYGSVLPAGLLREPVRGLRRAHAVILSRSEQISDAERAALRERIASLQGDGKKVLAEARHEPKQIWTAAGQVSNEWMLRERNVYAFCGIGNPQAFFETLKGMDANLSGVQEFPDHIVYTESMWRDIVRRSREAGADLLITTEKDWVKLKELPEMEYQSMLYWLEIGMVLTRGERELQELLDMVL